MSDFWHWQQDGAELDALMAKHSGRSYPPGVLAAYLARQRARHMAMQAAIDRLDELEKSAKCGGAQTGGLNRERL